MRKIGQVFSLVCLAWLIAASATWAQAPEEPLRDNPLLRGQMPWLEQPLALRIETPNGIYFVRVVGEIDGPARIPVSGVKGLKALEVATELHKRGGVSVALSAVVDELFITPIGGYEIAGRGGDAIILAELNAYGLAGWTMSLTNIQEEVADGCCGCGSLTCCPFRGKCLECGGCGSCCDKPAT